MSRKLRRVRIFFEKAFHAPETPVSEFRHEVRQKRTVFRLHQLPTVAQRTGGFFQPDFRTVVDVLNQRKDVTHIKTKERVTNIHFVYKKAAARTQYAPHFAKGLLLPLDVGQVMNRIDRINEIAGRVFERQLRDRSLAHEFTVVRSQITPGLLNLIFRKINAFHLVTARKHLF